MLYHLVYDFHSTSQLTDPVTATGTNNATGEDATISDTTISGLKANFTVPKQSVTYTFYAHNVGLYIAYLRSINFNDGKSCAATSTNTTISGHSLETNAYEQVVVTITYA